MDSRLIIVLISSITCLTLAAGQTRLTPLKVTTALRFNKANFGPNKCLGIGLSLVESSTSRKEFLEIRSNPDDPKYDPIFRELLLMAKDVVVYINQLRNVWTLSECLSEIGEHVLPLEYYSLMNRPSLNQGYESDEESEFDSDMDSDSDWDSSRVPSKPSGSVNSRRSNPVPQYNIMKDFVDMKSISRVVPNSVTLESVNKNRCQQIATSLIKLANPEEHLEDDKIATNRVNNIMFLAKDTSLYAKNIDKAGVFNKCLRLLGESSVPDDFYAKIKEDLKFGLNEDESSERSD